MFQKFHLYLKSSWVVHDTEDQNRCFQRGIIVLFRKINAHSSTKVSVWSAKVLPRLEEIRYGLLYIKASRLEGKYIEAGNKRDHSVEVNNWSILQVLIDLLSHGEAISRSVFSDKEIHRKEHWLMLPFWNVLADKLVVNLHLKHFLCDIGDSMLRGIFKRKAACTVLVVHIFSFEKQLGKIP